MACFYTWGVIAEGIRNNERVLLDDKPLADTLFHRAHMYDPFQSRLDRPSNSIFYECGTDQARASLSVRLTDNRN